MSDYFANLRREYTKSKLTKKELQSNPYSQFNKWLQDAINAGIILPNAMSLATTNNNEVTMRTVLLKELKDEKFIFFTNYDSTKAKQIAINNKVALLFSWLTLDRQITVSGIASKISQPASAKYFYTRPRASQLAAYVSKQSAAISSKSALLNDFKAAQHKFYNKKIPLPNWGGYQVSADKIEFWQGRHNRLHDRLLYLKENSTWSITRLNP